MDHVLIITDCDPITPDLERRLRLAQIQRLYQKAGADLDIVFLGRRSFKSAEGQALHRIFKGIERVGMLPDKARRDYLDQNNPHLFELIKAMRPNGVPFDAVHLDQVLVRPSDELAATWVLDTYDAAWEGPWVGRKFDALLAAFDGLRAHNAEFARHPMRLPLELPNVSGRRGSMIGWAGDFGNGLADRWSELLDVLADRGVQVRDGLLLAGPDVHWIRVPKVMSHLVVRSNDPKPGSGLALGLAVLPGDDAKAWLGRLTQQIAVGCPVLTTPGIAQMCDDRWHLPTCQGAHGFADGIEGWCDGRNRDDLLEATETSSEAFRYDSLAMDAYLRSALPIFGGGAASPIAPTNLVTV